MVLEQQPRYRVLWSGGLDSTYLIQHLLDQDPKNQVYASYVKVSNNSEKADKELAAIEKMQPILAKKYGSRFYYSGTCMEFSVLAETEMHRLKQIPLWLSAYLLTSYPRDDYFALGYVMNDCAVSYTEEIKEIAKSFSLLSEFVFPPIVFPLSKLDKAEIIGRIDNELLPHLWWCEHPKENSDERLCGACSPCKRMVEVDPSLVLKELQKKKHGKPKKEHRLK